MKMEFSAKNVDEALKLAVEHFNVKDEGDIEYKIVEEGSKGFLGLGAKETVIMAEKKPYFENMVEDYVKELFGTIDIDCEVSSSYIDEDVLLVSVIGEEAGNLIGRRGESLKSLQQIVSAVMIKKSPERKKIILDIENYREKRENSLRNFSHSIARKVLKSGRTVKMEPMSPYERRIVHASLSGIEGIKTHSEGEEPRRRVVVEFVQK